MEKIINNAKIAPLIELTGPAKFGCLAMELWKNRQLYLDTPIFDRNRIPVSPK